MDIFLEFLLKLIPLYVLIFLGYIGGKYLGIRKESIAPLLIYLITPVVIFTAVLNTKISLSTLSIPLLFFSISCFLSLLTYYFLGFFWKDSTRNILAYIAGSANIGYFGLPLAMAIFGERSIGIVALAVLGLALYSNSLGFFLTAKGHHTTKESLMKVLKLPLFYAFILGVIINLSAIKLSNTYFDMASNFNGVFVVLGMMLIGIGLSDVKMHKIDFKFIGISLITKFAIWPLIMLAIIFIDNSLFKLYDVELYKILMLLSIMPIAANTVSFAAVLNAQPEKASFAVLVSTLFASFYIPIIVIFFNLIF